MVEFGGAIGGAISDSAMKIAPICKAAILLVPLVWAYGAHAHGIAGNRYFDGTLTFDDPAVADEAILPYYENLAFPAARNAGRADACSLARSLPQPKAHTRPR